MDELDTKKTEFRDEFKNKLKHILDGNGQLTMDMFMRNKQDIFNALFDTLCNMHNSKEYPDVVKNTKNET